MRLATTKGEEIMTDLQFRAIIKMVYERFLVEIHSGKDPEQLEAALRKWVETVAGVDVGDGGYER
jgi:hypothetical protein